MAIYKTRNTGTGNGMRGMRGTGGMFTRIPGNLLEDLGECYYFNITGNVLEDSGNAEEDSEECWQRFSRILKNIERFIMQLNENRIKGYILKYNQKCYY